MELYMKFLLLIASALTASSVMATSLTTEQQYTYGSYFGATIRCAELFKELDSPEKANLLKLFGLTMVTKYNLADYKEQNAYKAGYNFGVQIPEKDPSVCDKILKTVKNIQH